MKRFLLSLLFCFLTTSTSFAAEFKLDGFGDEKIQEIKGLLASLDPLIQKRTQDASLATLQFEELYAVLNEKEGDFLRKFQNVTGDELGVTIPFRGIATGDEKLVRIEGQKIKMEGADFIIPPQYLPQNVYQNFLVMMDAMENDIGKRLYVESGYRSSAYQLYLFIFYLKNHDFSILDTVKWVALPGYSEHGSPQHQAIDFINADGISGETDPKLFEEIPEYRWLLENGESFGFVESYPKESKVTTYEPWHWRNTGSEFRNSAPK